MEKARRVSVTPRLTSSGESGVLPKELPHGSILVIMGSEAAHHLLHVFSSEMAHC